MEPKLEFREIAKVVFSIIESGYHHVKLIPSLGWDVKDDVLYLSEEGHFSNRHGRRIELKYITHILLPCEEVNVSELKERFIKECTDVFGDVGQLENRLVSISPDRVFEWFTPYFKGYPNTVIFVKDVQFVPANMKTCDCKRQFDHTSQFVCDGNCR